MLSLFPSLLACRELAPFLLRVTLGAVLLYWSYGRIKAKTGTSMGILGFLEGIAGILIIIGMYTQAAALVTALILAIKIMRKIQTKSLFTDGVNYYFILFVIAVSLLFLGAGAFAFDYPL